ncbi:MAG: AlpA family phage regulatory protein [Pseudomonadota bacterium]
MHSPSNSPVAAHPRLLRLRDVSEKTSLGKSAIYQRIASGTFPSPISISRRCTVWREDEVDAWINALPRGVGPRPGAIAAT